MVNAVVKVKVGVESERATSLERGDISASGQIAD